MVVVITVQCKRCTFVYAGVYLSGYLQDSWSVCLGLKERGRREGCRHVGKKERRKKTAKCLSMWASSMKGTFLGPSPLDTLYTVVPILRWVTFAVSSVSGLPLPGSDLPGMKPEEHAAQGLR